MLELESRIIDAMAAANCYFDEINSSENSIFFDGYTIFHKKKTCFRLCFESVEELTAWLNGVVFDDPEISDNVEKIMHPERFS